jgi:hypothetical protein
MDLGDCDRHPRIDVGELGSLFQGPGQGIDRFDLNGFESIAALHHNMFGIPVIHAHLGIRITQ